MSRSATTLAVLRRHTIARALFAPGTLPEAIDRIGFVQADPIRAPARAQDLILRQRVRDYRAGDLERQYPTLQVEEDYFVIYGFLPHATAALLHLRGARPLGAAARRQGERLVAAVRSCGELHPRNALSEDRDGRTRNYWGGTSRTTTFLLDRLHYAGDLRVARRDNGNRVYALTRHRRDNPDPDSAQHRADALVRLILRLYAPLPMPSLAPLVAGLRGCAPGLHREIRRAVERLRLLAPQARIGGTTWVWPDDESPGQAAAVDPSVVRLLAPFDPIVWDRRRFEAFWGWPYRFEAYTPVARRRFGYYALPVLWRERVIGWANVSAPHGRLVAEIGYVRDAAPRGARYARELEAELARMAAFLAVQPR